MTGKQLKSLRLKLGLTQAQLAKILNVLPLCIEKMESGEYTIRKTVAKIMKLMVENGMIHAVCTSPKMFKNEIRIIWTHGDESGTVSIPVHRNKKKIDYLSIVANGTLINLTDRIVPKKS